MHHSWEPWAELIVSFPRPQPLIERIGSLEGLDADAGTTLSVDEVLESSAPAELVWTPRVLAFSSAFGGNPEEEAELTEYQEAA